MFGVRSCPVCSKSFIKSQGNIYRTKYKGHIHNFCSYKCYKLIDNLSHDKNIEALDNILIVGKDKDEN